MKKRLIILASVVSALLVASVAWAYWTTEGGGTGSATVDATFPEELDVDSEVVDTDGDGLHPGDDIDLTVTVSNPLENEGTATFASVTGDVDAPDGCADGDFSIADLDDSDFDDPTIAAGDTAEATATLVFADDEDTSQDGCTSDSLEITWTIVNTP